MTDHAAAEELKSLLYRQLGFSAAAAALVALTTVSTAPCTTSRCRWAVVFAGFLTLCALVATACLHTLQITYGRIYLAAHAGDTLAVVVHIVLVYLCLAVDLLCCLGTCVLDELTEQDDADGGEV